MPLYVGDEDRPSNRPSGSVSRLHVARLTRVTQFTYDWRQRQDTVIPPADEEGRTVYSKQHYDNLDRVVKSERYLENDPAADTLLARSETLYDERGHPSG